MEYKLDDIVKEFIIEGGNAQMNKYPRFYTIAVSGLRELNMNQSAILRTIEMPIKQNMTCDLPLDYLQYSRIGVLDANGCLKSLAQCDCMSFLQSYNNCGEPEVLRPYTTSVISTTDGSVSDVTTSSSVSSSSNGVAFNPYGGNYRNGEFMGRMFGVGGGGSPYGEYRIDRENHILLVSNLMAGTYSIVMEYYADIENINGDFDVHPFIIEPLKAYIYWRSIQRDRNRSVSDKKQAKRDYDIAARWSKKRFTSSTITEWMQAFRSGNNASVKW
jgi:hypothetical protein